MRDSPLLKEEELFQLRPRLVRFFSSRGRAWAADDLADEALLRGLNKVRAGERIDNLAAYLLGICRLVLLEHLRSPAATHDPLAEEFEMPGPEPADTSLHDCLEPCLDRLGHDERSFILRFHGADAVEKNKDHRKRMASELGISMNAVFLRASRLRRQLRTCVEQCVERRYAPTAEKRSVQHFQRGSK